MFCLYINFKYRAKNLWEKALFLTTKCKRNFQVANSVFYLNFDQFIQWTELTASPCWSLIKPNTPQQPCILRDSFWERADPAPKAPEAVECPRLIATPTWPAVAPNGRWCQWFLMGGPRPQTLPDIFGIDASAAVSSFGIFLGRLQLSVITSLVINSH